MTMPTGHPRESDLRWTASPMWLAMMDAAIACGVEDRMDEARITDAKVWAKVGDPHWPSEDQAVRERFHALWTANVQARCGIDPEAPAPTAAPATTSLRVIERTLAVDARVTMIDRYAEGDETLAEVAAAFGVKRHTLARYLRDAGVPVRPTDPRKAARARWADPTQHTRQAAITRAQHARRMGGTAHAA